jgi:hypothetical protein
MSAKGGRRLSVELSDEQLRAIGPLVEATGRLKIVGTVEGRTLTVSHLACNAAFLACNAAFLACNAAFLACNAAFKPGGQEA